MANKFAYLFDPKEASLKLSLQFFTYIDKVKKDEVDELLEAYQSASDIALQRELEEADKGILR